MIEQSTLEKARLEVDWWYSIKRNRIPSIESPSFISLAAGSLDLALQIDYNVRTLCVKPSDSAYFDFQSCEIVLPQFYIDKNGLEELTETKLDGYAEYLSLAMINGSTIHEALHSRYTIRSPKKLLTAYVDSRYLAQIQRMGLGRAFYECFNIFEDLFIEAVARDVRNGVNSALNRMIEVKNEVMFPASSFAESVKQYDGSFKHLLSLILMLKNRSNSFLQLRNLMNAEDTAFVMAFTSGKLPTFSDTRVYSKMDRNALARVAIARADMVARFVIAHSEALRSIPEFEEGSGWDYHSSSSSSSLESVTNYSKSDSPQAERAAKVSGGTTSESAMMFNVEAGKIASVRHADDETAIMLQKVGKVEEVDIMQPGVIGKWHEFMKLHVDTKFAKSILLAMTTNTTHGEAKRYGSKIVNTRLNRIATDGKIFGTVQEIQRRKPMEIIILIDASGSTTRGTEIDGCNVPLIAYEVAFAESMFKTLKESRIPCAVYAHTSSARGETPRLYHIASSMMKNGSSGNIKARFERFAAIESRENFDGIVYEVIAKHFTNRPTEKLLIVLTDGAPSGPNYRGPEAETHTKEVIGKIRKRGINVIALSVGSKDIVEGNSRIFGSEYNVDATQTLSSEFKKIVTQFIN